MANVSAPVLISYADEVEDEGEPAGERASAGSQHDDDHHHHPMQIPSNVSAPVLISVDSCRMSQLPCSFPMRMQIHSNVCSITV